MTLDKLVKLYGRNEATAELAALRARVAELEADIASDARVDIENMGKIAALTARSEAAEARIAAALAELEREFWNMPARQYERLETIERHLRGEPVK